MKISKSNKNTKKKILITIVVTLSIIAITLLCLFFTPLGDNFRNQKNTQNTSNPPAINKVDYKGPTKEDTNNSQNAKEKLLEDSGNSKTPVTPSEPLTEEQKEPASVNISYADIINSNLEIRASTSSVIQGDGKCTATINKPGAPSITKTTQAFIDVSSTICEPIYIPRSQLTTGTWTVTVTYSSPTHQGSSGAYTVEVQ